MLQSLAEVASHPQLQGGGNVDKVSANLIRCLGF